MCIEGSGMRGFAGAEVARIGAGVKGVGPITPVIPGRAHLARTSDSVLHNSAAACTTPALPGVACDMSNTWGS